MALRDIVKDGDPILRKRCREVVDFDKKLGHILDDMLETMQKAEGVGLAAPQVGFLRRFVICLLSDGELLELVNPVVLEQSGEAILHEGCLSCPGKYLEVKRPSYIKLEYYDRHGEKHVRSFNDFNARVCLHEIDHLEGILFYDKAVKK